MSHNAKNYTMQGGELTVIGGTLRIDGVLEYGEGAEIPSPAKVENQADSEATTIATLKEDFNTLLSALKTAGLMEPDQTTGGGS